MRYIRGTPERPDKRGGLLFATHHPVSESSDGGGEGSVGCLRVPGLNNEGGWLFWGFQGWTIGRGGWFTGGGELGGGVVQEGCRIELTEVMTVGIVVLHSGSHCLSACFALAVVQP